MPKLNAFSRRVFLFGVTAAIIGSACPLAHAENDENESENNSDDGNDGSGGGDDGTGDSSSSGNTAGSGASPNSGSDQNKAQDAVKSGVVMPLSKAFDLLSARYPGRVIEVQLVARNNGFDYKFKVIDDAGNVTATSMDAATGHFRNRFGF
jgi:uncharacterized membrane protein YkoI